MKKWALLTKKYLTVIVSSFCIIICSCELGLNEPEDVNAQVPVLTAISNDITTNQNKAVTLSVTAKVTDNGTLSYQWYSATDKLVDGIALEQKNDFEFSPDVKNVGSKYYYCTITNTLGSDKKSVTTPRILVTVIPGINAQVPVIATQPVNISGELNQDFNFTVSAVSKDEGELTYQWYYSALKDGEYTPVQNAITQNLNSKILLTNLGYYYCIITNTITDNGDGGIKTAVAVTNKVILSNNLVNANPPVIMLQPKDVSGTIGQNFTFDVIASLSDQGTLSYQWYYYAVAGGNSTAIQNATQATYSANVSNTNPGYYYCLVTNTITDNGDGGKKTACVQTQSVSLEKIIVNAASPQISAQPIGATAVIPAVYTFTVGASSTDDGIITYQWYSIADTQNAEPVIISNATESNYSVSLLEVEKTGFYCVVTNTIADNGDGGTKTASVVSNTAWFEAKKLIDVVGIPVFEIQPKTMVVRQNEEYTLMCKAVIDNYDTVYKWYELQDGNLETKTPLTSGWTSDPNYTVAVFSEKGIRYFVCAAASCVPSDDEYSEKVVFSDIVAVSYTGLPVVYIDTVDGEEPTAEYVSPPTGGYGLALQNATKPKAHMKIFKDGIENAIYDSGEYNKEAKTGLTIKLRGNTSAYPAKKPYKLKLQKKADLLADLIPNRNSNHKDKEWILLKDATTLKTFVGMSVADLLGMPWTPEFAFVNVIINNTYRGVYLLIESINQNETRINVSSDGYIIERDAYWWNEDVKFITSLYNQKYTFKYPDEEDITEEQITYIANYMEQLEQHIQDGSYGDYLDLESFARWLLIHDILGTSDYAGSNIYMYKYDSIDSKICMATTWDYDSIYRMENEWAIIHNNKRAYAKFLFADADFIEIYKAQWNSISSSLCSNLSTKFDSLNNLQGEDIDLSRKCDANKYGSTAINTIGEDLVTANDWFESRVIWLNAAIYSLE